MLLKKISTFTCILSIVGVLSAHAGTRDIDFDFIKYHQFSQLPTVVVSETNTLLLSDSPEYVGPTGGVLSAGTINGTGRVYFYHVNEMAEPQKMAIVLENTSVDSNTVQVYREIKSIATDDYFAAGRDLSKKDLEQPVPSKPIYSFSIKGRGKHIVFPDLNNATIQKDELFTGIVDFESDKPVMAQVMMIPLGADPINASETISQLPIDEVRLRGTFTGANRHLLVNPVYNTSLGGAYIEIGNDREDTFLEGVDELDNKAYVKDVGNYGVSYTLTIPTVGTDPFRLYFNPIGGAYSGSFAITTKRRWQRDEGHTVMYHIGGEDGLRVLGHNTIEDSRYMGNYYGGDTLTIRFMPAGASNLPFRFVLVPEALANPQYKDITIKTEPRMLENTIDNARKTELKRLEK